MSSLTNLAQDTTSLEAYQLLRAVSFLRLLRTLGGPPLQSLS